jgi:predicted RNA-binding protein YlxR (DUF448 family)
MTIKDLQRIVLESDQSEDSKEMQDLQRKLQGRPFYIWSSIKHAENLRKESKIMVPDRNIEPAVTSIQTDQSKSVQIRHEPELQGGFAALAKKGTIKFTSYEEARR